MSKLDNLIQQLCPNGVEWKTIGSLTRVLRGKRLTTSQLSVDGKYKVFHGGIEPIGYYNDFNRGGNTVMIINVGASAGTLNYCAENFWSSDGCFCIEKTKYLNDRFLFHFLQNNELLFKSKVRRAGIPTLDVKVIENLSIPVPPLPIQEEIVRILDSFTSLTAELQAELQARRVQYEWYSDKLLNESCAYSNLKIGDIIESLKTGLNPRTNFKLNVDGAECPYITGKDVFNNSINISDRTDKITQDAVYLINKRACLHDDILLFASTGTGTVGRMAIVKKYAGNWNVSETLYCITPKNTILTSYLMYSLYSKAAKEQFEPKISKGSVPHLKVSDLLNVEIPIPPIEEQQRIVDILDRFDAYCNDITQGLPAEIEARQKQYEYYRDKLLTFKKVEE